MKDLKTLLKENIRPEGQVGTILSQVASTSSKLKKEAILKAGMTPLIDQILKDTYGPAKYNIKAYNISSVGQKSIDDCYDEFHAVLETLAARKVTGNAAKQLVDDTISAFNESSQIILVRILNRNLKIGAGDTFAEESGATEKFPVRLANTYKDVCNRIDIFDGNWLVSRKLDGCRCLAFISSHDGEVSVSFRSRQNKEFTTLSKLVPAYQKLFSNTEGEYVVDGEICILDEEGNEQFHGLMSEITKKDHTIEHPIHVVYDLLTADEFWGKEVSPNFSDRINKLYNIYVDACNWVGNISGITILEQTELTSKEQLNALQDMVDKLGWEGLMVAKNVPYTGKRTNDILKIKGFKDDEYIVIDTINGDQARCTESGSEMVTTLSALVIEHKGNRVKVGGGMTYEQRDRWYEHPEEIIGKTVCIQYFEETTDKKTGLKSLRFPTLKYVYENGREV